MRLAAVESAHNLRLQPVSLRRVFRFNHLLGEPAQFFRAKRMVLPGVTGELDDPVLFVLRQAFYFLNDFNRCHVTRLLLRALPRKPAEP